MTTIQLQARFVSLTGLKIGETYTQYGWFTIVPNNQQLNCEQLEDISHFIRSTFTVKGNYTHKLPKLQFVHGSSGGYYIGLRLDLDLIKETEIKLG
jgi:hypothetical protein